MRYEWTAEIVVSDEKPFSTEYDVKRSKLTVKLHYMVKIKYGITCSHWNF